MSYQRFTLIFLNASSTTIPCPALAWARPIDIISSNSSFIMLSLVGIVLFIIYELTIYQLVKKSIPKNTVFCRFITSQHMMVLHFLTKNRGRPTYRLHDIYRSLNVLVFHFDQPDSSLWKLRESIQNHYQLFTVTDYH